ncbi:MAG: acyltransferase [candidate division WOR-3 bacterium]
MKLLKPFIIVLGFFFYNFKRIFNHCIKKYLTTKFKKVGKNFYFGNHCIFTFKNITIGNNVFIADFCVIQSTHGEVIIKDNVMIGPGVHIHGGNHEYKKIGFLMNEIKRENEIDKPVIIEEDCWIGANAIILNGVKIGKGSIIGAGSIVTKDIPPYTIYLGSPPLKILKRYTDEQIVEHEKKLYERKK